MPQTIHTLPPEPQPEGEPPLTHASPSQQPAQVVGPQLVMQEPQSPGQAEQVSPTSQTRLPQDTTPQGPQSAGQLEQLSPTSQTPLPQDVLHGPQSAWQLEQVSPALGSQKESPHRGAFELQPASSVAPSQVAPSQRDTVVRVIIIHLPYPRPEGRRPGAHAAGLRTYPTIDQELSDTRRAFSDGRCSMAGAAAG